MRVVCTNSPKMLLCCFSTNILVRRYYVDELFLKDSTLIQCRKLWFRSNCSKYWRQGVQASLVDCIMNVVPSADYSSINQGTITRSISILGADFVMKTIAISTDQEKIKKI